MRQYKPRSIHGGGFSPTTRYRDYAISRKPIHWESQKTYLSYGVAAAFTAQCGNGIVRVTAELRDPDGLDILNQEEWYQKTSLVIDTVSLVGAVTATATTLKTVLALRSGTGKSTVSILKGLSRQERKRLAEELVRVENPGISNKQLKLLVSKGIYPKRFSKGQVPETLRRELVDAAGAAMSFTGSATGGALQKGMLVIGFGDAMDTY